MLRPDVLHHLLRTRNTSGLAARKVGRGGVHYAPQILLGLLPSNDHRSDRAPRAQHLPVEASFGGSVDPLHLRDLCAPARPGSRDRRGEARLRERIQLVVHWRYLAYKQSACRLIGAHTQMHPPLLRGLVAADHAAPPRPRAQAPQPCQIAPLVRHARVRRLRRSISFAGSLRGVGSAPVQSLCDEQRRFVEAFRRAEHVKAAGHAHRERAPLGRYLGVVPIPFPGDQIFVTDWRIRGRECRLGREEQLRLQIGHAPRPLLEARAEAIRPTVLPLHDRPQVVRDVV